MLPESGLSFSALCQKAIRLFRHRAIDVVHAHRYKENLLAWVVATALGVSSRISTIHGMPEWHGSGRQVLARAMRSLNLTLLKRGFSKTVAVSHEIERILHRDHGFSRNQLVSIHNGIPLPPMSEVAAAMDGKEAGEKTLTIGTIGRLVPVKGFELFLEIAEQVSLRLGRVKFVLVGDGPEKAKLERIVSARGLYKYVEFLPVCPDPSCYYRSFDVYLNTSVHEGIPLTILEAMAWAKPVIAANVGGIPEIVEHETTGILVMGRDPEAFTQWCVTLAADQVLRTQLGVQARASIEERFGVEAMAASYAALYEGQSAKAGTACVGEHVLVGGR